MTVKGIVDEDLSNYKKPSMLIAMARCSLKCDELNGCSICQNSPLLFKADIEISNEDLINRYNNNNLTQALVFGGLEPMDQFSEVISFIKDFREVSDDDIVIYTGYTKEEMETMGCLDMLKAFPNIVLKVGRFIVGYEPHEDPILGVMLASDNQYAIKIS